MPESTIDRSLKWYSTKEPLIVLLLSALAVVFFLAVAGLSRMFHAQQTATGDEFYKRGIAELTAGDPNHAVRDFRTALLYSRDNFSYQLSLAQALVGQHLPDEAYTYLFNLWQREPENGTVNLELARIYAARGKNSDALRFYHNAVYAIWGGAAEDQRRAVRLELIDFLLRSNSTAQAQAELIALAANLPENAPLLTRVGDLFVEAQDYEHAFEEYRQALRLDRHNAAAEAGAGRAAFELGRYPQAQRYLQAAVSENSADGNSRSLLQTTDLVLEMDPFRRQISVSRRNQVVLQAFAAAGERLKECGLKTTPAPAVIPTIRASGPTTPAVAPAPPKNDLAARWAAMKPQVTARGLRHDPDLADSAMDLVFSIEQQTSTACGAPTGRDLALLLISRLREGN
ncbi:MAG TPA: tetratricopeptide repeat protein [Terriglobales bacterium]|nr:tetratricopeptide repeat protein [Terriglobales bacterium]